MTDGRNEPKRARKSNIGTLLFIAALLTSNSAYPHAGGGPHARAAIADRDGAVIGEALFTQAHGGVIIRIKAQHLPAGWHGIHIHQKADCTTPDFTSSEGHINPEGARHGLLNVNGPDAGDLPNLYVHGDGGAEAELFTPLVSVDGEGGLPRLLDEDGAAIVIHADEDDHISQPIGNAGARIACGEITPIAHH